MTMDEIRVKVVEMIQDAVQERLEDAQVPCDWKLENGGVYGRVCEGEPWMRLGDSPLLSARQGGLERFAKKVARMLGRWWWQDWNGSGTSPAQD